MCSSLFSVRSLVSSSSVISLSPPKNSEQLSLFSVQNHQRLDALMQRELNSFDATVTSGKTSQTIYCLCLIMYTIKGGSFGASHLRRESVCWLFFKKRHVWKLHKVRWATVSFHGENVMMSSRKQEERCYRRHAACLSHSLHKMSYIRWCQTFQYQCQRY